MVITLDAELESALNELARSRMVAPEVLAAEVLRATLLPPPPPPFEPRDEWERRLLAIGTDCGVVLPESALSREEMYD